jgi:beta-lactam-binding protein with PASTA domain
MLKGLSLSYEDGGTQASALPAGQVVGTTPAAGTVLSKGESVTVFTSDGSGAAPVPDVTGQSIANAKTAIAAAGFSVDKVAVAGFTAGDGKNQCRVAGTDPAIGTSVAKDAAVGLTLYGNPQGADPGNCK